MAVSPRRPSLYRKVALAVTVAATVLLLTQVFSGQASPPRRKPTKGPRALGLMQLFPNGTAHLIPITILIDGNFYDAGAYKAAPVPMALESRNVYEAVRSGVSQGLFTVGGVRQTKDSWVADGSWLPAGATPSSTAHKAESKPNMGADEGPPTLRRPGSAKKPDDSQPSQAPAKPPADSPPTPSAGGSPSPATTSAPAPKTPAATPEPPQEDANRPVLRRGKPSPSAESKDTYPTPSATTSPSTKPVAKDSNKSAPSETSPAKNAVQLIPAISDADGPDPHSYLYEAKPDEDEKLRKKMLALATDDLLASVKAYAPAAVEPPPSAATRQRKTSPTKTPQPVFDDIQLKIFDLSSSNEPVLVLTGTAHMPPPPKSEPSTAADTQYFVTLVERNDIYGDLHKVFSSVTDNHHLDAIPRMEFIDAVDVDGDGRGELLFRKVSDTSSAYSVYRQIGDRLWPLFEGALP